MDANVTPVTAQQVVDLLNALKFRLEVIERRQIELHRRFNMLEGAYVKHVRQTHQGWGAMVVSAEDVERLITDDQNEAQPAAH